jgi:membrane protein DedA with SNARE-associated domain
MWLVAIAAALGSLVGDIIMFRFARDRFTYYLRELLKHEMHAPRLGAIFHMRLFRWVTFFIGALIIASPLPDELGIAFLGFSRVSTALFAPLSLVANFIGIAGIIYLAHPPV